MPISIKQLRANLQISLDDLGFLLGVGRSRVHHIESGRSMESRTAGEKLHQLSKLARKAEQSKTQNPWINDQSLNATASAWLDIQRQRAADTAEELKFRLQEMKAEYKSSLKALDILAGIKQNPECTGAMKKWIETVKARVIKRAMKCSPMEQAKLELRRKEALGRAK